jgi:hypothetical protein
MIEGVIFFGFSAISMLFWLKAGVFNKSMISFHEFLNNYRQTPRSRFIRKYKPQHEPVYEELSAFERSYMSSQVGGGNLHVSGTIHHDLETMHQVIERGGLDQSTSMKVFSMYMGRSSINYNEINNRFEEHFERILPENIAHETSFIDTHVQIMGTIGQSQSLDDEDNVLARFKNKSNKTKIGVDVTFM